MVGHRVCVLTCNPGGRGQRGSAVSTSAGQHCTGSRRASGKCFQFHNFPLLSWFIVVQDWAISRTPKPEIRLAGNCETSSRSPPPSGCMQAARSMVAWPRQTRCTGLLIARWVRVHFIVDRRVQCIHCVIQTAVGVVLGGRDRCRVVPDFQRDPGVL